jgi:hypothetical protein
MPEECFVSGDCMTDLLQELIDAPEQDAGVPDELPTKEMTAAFSKVFNVRKQRETFGPAVRAMLAAAPEAPASQVDQSEQHLEMARDAERLNWILPSVTGEDSQTANTRTFLLAHQLLTGKTGKTAIDAAIAAENGGA